MMNQSLTANEITRLETLVASLTTVARCNRARDLLGYCLPAGRILNTACEMVFLRKLELKFKAAKSENTGR